MLCFCTFTCYSEVYIEPSYAVVISLVLLGGRICSGFFSFLWNVTSLLSKSLKSLESARRRNTDTDISRLARPTQQVSCLLLRVMAINFIAVVYFT